MAGSRPPSPWVRDLWLGSEEGRPNTQALGRHRGPMPGTRLEASAALELQDLMATGATSSRNKFSSSRIVVYLQQLAGERFQKGVCWGTQRQPLTVPFSLAQALQH